MGARARAEVWRYDDPGHPEHGTWSWQLLDRPWTEPMDDDRASHILDVPGDADRMAWPSWRAAFDTALAAVCSHREAAT